MSFSTIALRTAMLLFNLFGNILLLLPSVSFLFCLSSWDTGVDFGIYGKIAAFLTCFPSSPLRRGREGFSCF